jgi:hypothetical protein
MWGNALIPVNGLLLKATPLSRLRERKEVDG